MKIFLQICKFFTILLVFLLSGCSNSVTKVLVITGGHSYDTVEFIDVFNSIKYIEFDTLIQPAANKFLTTDEASNYDIFVFYDMWEPISEEEKQAYIHLLDAGKGMVFMHHSLVSYQQWPEFEKIIGGRYKQPRFRGDTLDISSYKHDINIPVRVLDTGHPVTKGIRDFTIHDEAYKNTFRLESVTPLLGTENPYCTDVLAWAHTYSNSRIVYLLLGHDKQAFGNKHFRRLTSNAILWTAGRN